LDLPTQLRITLELAQGFLYLHTKAIPPRFGVVLLKIEMNCSMNHDQQSIFLNLLEAPSLRNNNYQVLAIASKE